MTADIPHQYGPWNPGLESELPRKFLPLSTVFSPSNVSTDIEELSEYRELCGLPIERMSAFRPERLALHEVLIRVMADLSVPDGDKYADLGVNFRHITATLIQKHFASIMPEIRDCFARLTHEAAVCIEGLYDRPSIQRESLPQLPERRGSWRRMFSLDHSDLGDGASKLKPHAAVDDFARIDSWRDAESAAGNVLEQVCLRSLATAGGAIFSKHGRLLRDRSLLTGLAVRLVLNDYGSREIGRILDRYFEEAAQREGYRLLPPQSRPIVMNVKGASAAGKSTMRPLQKELAQRLGVDWADFALISPDIWRKYLLDYDSLGSARRYAGTLTALEIEIIDKKLDRYMAQKAKAGRMSHLLIDRFRFDSFADEADDDEGGGLLTRFGDEIYMFFMITPPEATVERAWHRGEKVGRYKAVEDLLAHNVEAYNGIPGLFFTWALNGKKKVHYEFLDNSVPQGQLPRTVAFGMNGQINVLDVGCLLNIDRFRSINIAAKSEAAVYQPRMQATSSEVFLLQLIRRLPQVNFADWRTGEVYARTESGNTVFCRRRFLEAAGPETNARLVLGDLLSPLPAECPPETRLEVLATDPRSTLGRWCSI